MATLTLDPADIAEVLPVTLTKPGLTEEEYFDLCAQFDDFFVEYTADGTVIFMPGTEPKTSDGVGEVNFQLRLWARQDGRGWVGGPDGSFLFPNRARRRMVRRKAMEHGARQGARQKSPRLRARVCD